MGRTWELSSCPSSAVSVKVERATARGLRRCRGRAPVRRAPLASSFAKRTRVSLPTPIPPCVCAAAANNPVPQRLGRRKGRGEGSLPSDEAFGKASRAPLRIRKSQHFVRTSLSKPKGISLISERRVSHQLHSFITASSRGTCSCAPTWPSLEPSPSARHRASSLTRRQ